MRQQQRLLIPAVVFSLMTPLPIWAAEGGMESMEEVTPTFQNAAQAERAANLANSSFTEQDMKQAMEGADTEATKQIDALAKEYADGVVDQISSDYADKVVSEKATAYANKAVEDAGSLDPRDPNYLDPADPEYEAKKQQIYDGAYSDAYKRATGGGDQWEDEWHTAYNKAHARATGGGEEWEDAWHTAYNHAVARATNPDYPNAYQAAYMKALEAEVAEITGEKLQEIHRLRYVERLGWGVITRKRLGLHNAHAGRGNIWKHKIPPSVEDVPIPTGPPDNIELPLVEEIAEATRRNVRTGLHDDPEFEAVGTGKKGNKKKYGLAQTSGLAGEEARGGSKKGSVDGKEKSSPGGPGQVAASDKSKKGGNSNRGGNGKKGGNNNASSKSSKGDKGGNNGNKGGNNGSKGGNGKNN